MISQLLLYINLRIYHFHSNTKCIQYNALPNQKNKKQMFRYTCLFANYQPTTPTKSNVPRRINRIDFEVTEIHQRTTTKNRIHPASSI